jgi:hypothetical protein
MKMNVAGFFENFASNYPLAQCHIPEKQNSHLHHCENLNTVSFAAIWYTSTLTLQYTKFKSDKTQISTFLFITSSQLKLDLLQNRQGSVVQKCGLI